LSNPEAARFIDQLTARFVLEGQPVNIDWWGHLPYYTILQVFQQAVEAAGTLDNARVAEVMRNHSFPDTVMGTVHFVNNQIAGEVYLGQIGQWQSGIYHVIDVSARNRTAAPIIPKPPWP
jgi:ABC-type branched-subunit amino acid transport system substrate-binding protein